MRKAILLIFFALMSLNLCAQQAEHLPVKRIHATDSISLRPDSVEVVLGRIVVDSIANELPEKKVSKYDVWEEREVAFNPDPTKAVWMSALFPGLGQLYNRRYWKLPIVIGGYMGLGYATSWNNSMLTDYTRAYRDLMDNDPNTNSYMDFFPPNTKEEDLDKTWLTNIMQSRKNFYRRNRDLCIICMVAVSFVAMGDAYVDASLSHFDITPDLSLDWSPSVVQDVRGGLPSVGLMWALTF